MMNFMFNFLTGEYDAIPFGPMNGWDEEDYVPYIPRPNGSPDVVVDLYRCHITLGDTPMNAYIKTLTLFTEAAR